MKLIRLIIILYALLKKHFTTEITYKEHVILVSSTLVPGVVLVINYQEIAVKLIIETSKRKMYFFICL